jgi:hypothetical protein
MKMILQPGIVALLLFFVSASAMNISDNYDLFAKVFIEAEAEVDQMTLEKTINGHKSRLNPGNTKLVPGHSRRGVTKQ